MLEGQYIIHATISQQNILLFIENLWKEELSFIYTGYAREFQCLYIISKKF